MSSSHVTCIIVRDYTRPLSTASFNLQEISEIETEKKRRLHSLLVSLEKPSRAAIHDAIFCLKQDNVEASTITTIDTEAETLERAVMSKLVIGVYTESLQLLLDQSIELEDEAEWWAEVQRSSSRVAWYLLQTLPARLLNLLNTIRNALKANHMPFRPSHLTPSSLKRLFPSTNSLRPSLLLTSLFPHLRHKSQMFTISASHILSISQPPRRHVNIVSRFTESFFVCLKWSLTCLTIPLNLAWEECNFKRASAEKARDERAKMLGSLAQKRGVLAGALEQESIDVQRRRFYYHLRPFALNLQSILNEEPAVALPKSPTPEDSLLDVIEEIVSVSLPTCAFNHQSQIKQLQRPSKLLLLWPRIILLPPLTILALRSIYVSRATLNQMANDAKETVRGFLVGWLIQPLRDILNTVRTGGEEGLIVRREGVIADLESLERMTLALAKEQLHYTPEQLQQLSQQVRQGDLTPVSKLYEDDIKRPLKSAIAGTLLRSLFIQIQKAKVDIDQAITGIDKLLKSQELTFAFVGVAPALVIVYSFGTYLSHLWIGGRGRHRYGGKRKRASVMYTMRRIERLLIVDSGPRDVSSLTAGLLLLSVKHLRTYGELCLPAQSRLKAAFLEDVGDLEDPELGREDKIKVVERMWRSFGTVLGWNSSAEQGR